MKTAVLLLAALGVAAAKDPKVQPLRVNNEEEAAAALVEEPRDKRNWFYQNPVTGVVEAFVEGGDAHPAQVAEIVASVSASNNIQGTQGRTGWNPQGRTGADGFTLQQLNQWGAMDGNAWRNWQMFNYWRQQRGLGSVPFNPNMFGTGFNFNNFNNFNSFDNNPDVIDTATPQGRTRLAQSNFGTNFGTYAPGYPFWGNNWRNNFY